MSHEPRNRRGIEGLLIALVLGIGALALGLLWGAEVANTAGGPTAVPPLPYLGPFAAAGLALLAAHIALRIRRARSEELVLPLVGFIFFVGLTTIHRLLGEAGAWQQITRGWIPGLALLIALAFYPRAVEWIRRLAVPISVGGLLLTMATGAFGVADETGARLALKIGPLPAIQTSELIKVSLIIFLAWFIEREAEVVEGRARVVLGWFRFPSLRHFLPGLLAVGLATLTLVWMSDFGAVLILGLIYIGILFAGFESRLFGTVALIGGALAGAAGAALALFWRIPAVITNRFLAFLNPWSEAPWMINGQPTGFTIAQGPGYQIQQAIYATVAGGLTGAGPGLGSPEYIPLGASDFIFASVLEEFGALTGLAILAAYAIILLRLLRLAALLPRDLVFERLLLVGIAIHFFAQVLVMVGGTLNVLPMTGVTLPFLSLGGSALLTNLFEVGLALSLAQRIEGRR